MCTSETTICYGVVIRSWQLIVAAHAFIKFSPLLRGIDTVILRQRNGTLRVEGEDVGGGKNVGDMPVEVLELIRSKVFCEKELEIEGCELVAGEDDESEGWRRIPLPHRGLNPGGCGCWDNHDQALNEIDLSSIRLLLDTLLEYYGLALVSDVMANQGGWMIENASTSVIALPSSVKKITVETDHGGLPRANGISLPSRLNHYDSVANFHRFFRDFHFDVVADVTKSPPAPSTITPSITPTSQIQNKTTDSKKADGKAKESEAAAIMRPGWIVWSINDAC